MELLRREILILIGVGVLMILLPILFTQDLGLISFKETGPIGDTIGGITAPLIGFFGAVLLYLTLKAQIEANKQIQAQFKDQAIKESLEKLVALYEDRIKTLAVEINSFQFSVDINVNHQSHPRDFQTFLGSQAIYQLLKQRRQIYTPEWKSAYILEPKFEELRQLLIWFLAISDSLNKEVFIENPHENEKIKSYFEKKLRYYFTSKLKGTFLSMVKYKAPDIECPNCSSTHGIPEDLFEIVKKIEQQLE